MNKILLNDAEFEIDNFNKTTTYSNGTITSTAYVSALTNDGAVLNALGLSTITSIKIYYNDKIIYTLENIEANIESINEYLATDHIGVNININFKGENSNNN